MKKIRRAMFKAECKARGVKPKRMKYYRVECASIRKKIWEMTKRSSAILQTDTADLKTICKIMQRAEAIVKKQSIKKEKGNENK